MTDTLNPTTDAAASAIDRSAADVVADLTLEEKASLTSGASFWTTKPVERVGLPAIMLTDGPHGVRKQRASADHLGIGDSVPATCFPPAVALGSSFDPELLVRVGAALGEESQAERVGVLLGPGINIKRSPLCGRNFEYLSEDPIVSGVLGSALVRGLQSQGVGASLKHFAANNQEADRMRVSADIDERPLREIYLRGFQRVVAGRAAVDRHVLVQPPQRRLRVRGPVAAHEGAPRRVGLRRPRRLGLGRRERPRHRPRRGPRPRDAVERGPHRRPARRRGALGRARRAPARHGRPPQRRARAEGGARCEGGCRVRRRRPPRARARGRRRVDRAAEERRRRAAARRRSVRRRHRRVRPHAALPGRRVVAHQPDAARQRARRDPRARRRRHVPAPRCRSRPATAPTGPRPTSSRAEAVAVAAAAETVVLFLGVPASQESEGFDRDDIELPAAQLALVDAVIAANPRTVVVLSNGGVVRLSGLADRVPAIVEGWLLGQAGGGAVADVLYGAVNPSGRLAETIPVRLADSPAYLDFPGEHSHVRYGEGLFVGYRWYDARDLEVSYPFGHGLSYTTFGYSDAAVSSDASGLTVRVTVTNTGDRAGADVVQVYTSLPGSAVVRAPRELKGFAKVALEAGESREVVVHVRREDLAYWDTRVDRWLVEGGSYTVEVGASSRDIRATVQVDVEGDAVRVPLTLKSSIGELMAHPVASQFIMQAMAADDTLTAGLMADPGMFKMMESFPIGRLASFPGMPVGREQVEQLLAAANAAS